MTEPSGELALAAEFPEPTREQWRTLVDGVLRRSGVDVDQHAGPIEDLIASRSYDGVTIAPLYTAQDAVPPTGLPGLPPFTRGSRPQGGVTSGWDVRQRHDNPDPAAARDAVLADLEHGVTSVWLRLGGDGLPVAALGRVLDGVYLDLAPVVLDAGAEFAEAADALLRLYAERGVPAAEVRGNLGADPIGVQARTGVAGGLDDAAALAARTAREFPALRSIVVDALPYHEAGGSDAEELGCSLAAGVAYLRALTGAGLSVDEACGQLEFRYAASADQFLTIAKFRAARRLWARVAEVSGAAGPSGAQAQHAVTSTAMMTRRDPWVNLLRATIACFGAGLGGADSVTVLPFDAAIGLSDDFARRIARNTQSLLLEESRLAAVIDPAGGSWYVERLTDELARAAWAWFQRIERAGGLPAALASGLVAGQLAETWAARSANIANRTDAITGVSEFPHLAEKPVSRPPAPAEPTGGLPRIRYAQAFEDLRDRADAHLAATGSRPSVFLATLGPVSAHTARATVAANLFQAGGIETVSAGATGSVEEVLAAFEASGARIACVCGSEKSYVDQAERVAAALKQAGAARVLLVGTPTDSYRRAGVDEFVFTRCPALDVLTNSFAILGVA
ncbi:methylmalonyl-CoA mutase [Solihabitans fulvus]|uniref:Methylmalonyl-CoA mutase n=1 Tax=Solihabitans fulvus TaxID=1892852 RepID=A0A5B2WL14_9PSEU|nr:methylmalonyl-CoA mutase family protein [Solihabitans fulvus]KAA2251186.1 methylmalonyl-CoA mutase [Solihabitans fulvus]